MGPCRFLLTNGEQIYIDPWFLQNYDCDGDNQIDSGGGFSKLYSTAWHSWQLDSLEPCSVSVHFHPISLSFPCFKWGPQQYRFNLKKAKVKLNFIRKQHSKAQNAVSLCLRQILFALTYVTEDLSVKANSLNFQLKINCQLLLVFFLSLCILVWFFSS